MKLKGEWIAITQQQLRVTLCQAVVLTHEMGSAEPFRIYDHVHVQNGTFSLTIHFCVSVSD